MSIQYKLQRKRNPQKRTEPGKWYAVPKTGKPEKEKNMTRMATEDTTVADIELAAAAKLIGRFICNQVLQGKRVRIPGVGTFRLSFSSDGVDNIQDFHTGLIRDIKVLYLMDADLRNAILNNISFENAGVDDEGVQYASMENYKEVKGLTGGSSTPGTGGGSDDGEL